MEELHELIPDEIDVREGNITPNAHFMDDIGVESVGSLVVLVRLEPALGIRIPESYLSRLASLKEVRISFSEITRQSESSHGKSSKQWRSG